MTTTTRTSSPSLRGSVVLEDISWRNYERLGRIFYDRPIRMNYDRGRLEIMTLSTEHESYKHLLGQLVVLLALELGIRLRGVGSMTFKRRPKKRGLEPDECYWIQNEAAVRGRKQIDLDVVPPPDLVLEIEISRTAISRLGLYAAIGVPEVWRFDGAALNCVLLGSDGNYHGSPRSQAFPFLNPAVIASFCKPDHAAGEVDLLREFQLWVREQQVHGWPDGGLSGDA